MGALRGMIEGSGRARFSENAEPALSHWQGLNLVSKEQWHGRFERCFRCNRYDSPGHRLFDQYISRMANLAALATLAQVTSSPRRITTSHSSGVTGCTERRLPR
jgi:hypothetical protein